MLLGAVAGLQDWFEFRKSFRNKLKPCSNLPEIKGPQGKPQPNSGQARGIFRATKRGRRLIFRNTQYQRNFLAKKQTRRTDTRFSDDDDLSPRHAPHRSGWR